MRAGCEHGVDGLVTGVEVGGQNLDHGGRVEGPDSLNSLSKMFRTSIGEIIPRNGGDHDVLKTHPVGGFSDARRFVGFESEGPGGSNGAEMAGAGAAVTSDHERRRAFTPTFPV